MDTFSYTNRMQLTATHFDGPISDLTLEEVQQKDTTLQQFISARISIQQIEFLFMLGIC